MKQLYKTILLSIVILTTVSNLYSQALVSAAIYTSRTRGTLSGVPFTFTNVSPNIQNLDLSGRAFVAAPLSTSQPTLNYDSSSNWTLTFDSPITGLKLYCAYWRTLQVRFSEPFKILSRGDNFQNPSGNLLNTIEFGNGLIEFTNPITTLSVTVITGGANAQMALTLAAAPPLSTDDFLIKNNDSKIYPNPSTNFIQISGLKNTENYSIYNIFGSEILKGSVSVDGKIDIKNYSNGLYFLKLENGKTIKFLKE